MKTSAMSSSRSDAIRIAGGGAQRNPRSSINNSSSRVAATHSRPLCNAAARHEVCDFASGGSATLRPRLFTSCRSAAPANTRRGFTIVELLVVITIIVMLAGMALGAMAKARERGKLEATKSTIAKINDLVMKRYESYRTRRIPMYTSGQNPNQVMLTRLIGIRDLMRMEMPERWVDITTKPLVTGFPASKLSPTVDPSQKYMFGCSLQAIYLAKYLPLTAGGPKVPTDHQQAKCLYLWVTTAMPEAKGLFRGEEIADVDKDGFKCFVDGWGNPIGFLRWAPGASSGQTNGWSDIQVTDATNHHDPFDPMITENGNGSTAQKVLGYSNAAYQLYPLDLRGRAPARWPQSVEGKSTITGSPWGTISALATAMSQRRRPTPSSRRTPELARSTGSAVFPRTAASLWSTITIWNRSNAMAIANLKSQISNGRRSDHAAAERRNSNSRGWSAAQPPVPGRNQR